MHAYTDACKDAKYLLLKQLQINDNCIKKNIKLDGLNSRNRHINWIPYMKSIGYKSIHDIGTGVFTMSRCGLQNHPRSRNRVVWSNRRWHSKSLLSEKVRAVLLSRRFSWSVCMQPTIRSTKVLSAGMENKWGKSEGREDFSQTNRERNYFSQLTFCAYSYCISILRTALDDWCLFQDHGRKCS